MYHLLDIFLSYEIVIYGSNEWTHTTACPGGVWEGPFGATGLWHGKAADPFDFCRSNTWTSPSCWEHEGQHKGFFLHGNEQLLPWQPGCIASPSKPGWVHLHPPAVSTGLHREDAGMPLPSQQSRLIALFLMSNVSCFLQPQAGVRYIKVYTAGIRHIKIYF